MNFKELPYGARFKYKGGSKIWIKMIPNEGCVDCGLIVEYDEKNMRIPNWVGQKIVSFCDNPSDMKWIEIEVVD